MSGLGLVSDYNNDSEQSEDAKEQEATAEATEKEQKVISKLGQLAGDKSRKKSSRDKDSSAHSAEDGKKDSDRRDRECDKRDKHKDRRDDRDRRDDGDNRRVERKYNDRPRDNRSRDGGGRRGDRRGDRRGHNDRHRRGDKDREYMDYKRKKYGDNLEWGKANAEALKDVKTDSTLPSTFDTTIAKQLAAQREKRKLLWGGGKKEGEASTTKNVWGAGSIKNDESGEQTAKFLKLMGVKDVTAENVKNFKTDESVHRSSQVVEGFEEEYEKSRYLQHMQKGVGLGLIQFAKREPPT